MFMIESIYDVIAILSILISAWLAYKKLFVEGKPNMKFDVKFLSFPNSLDKITYLAFSIINSGYGDLHLTNCGFFTNAEENNKTIILPGGYLTIPLGERFPYTLKERKRFEVLYPKETLYEINAKNRITDFFVSDEAGKEWKYPIRKFRKMLNLEIK